MPTRFLRLTAALTVVAGALGAVAMRPALAAPKPAAPKTIEGIPAIKHAFVIVLENESFDTSFGPGSPAVYLNGLLSQGAFADNYYGVSHLSAGKQQPTKRGESP